LADRPMAGANEDPSLTRLLNLASAGDGNALDIDALYERCRGLVRRVKAHAGSLDDLGTTDLLHRAWERTMLSHGDAKPSVHWQSREHFFATLAKATIQAIIDERRSRLTAKRGGRDRPRQSIDAAKESADRRLANGSSEFDAEDRAALRQSLDELGSIDPRACSVVILRHCWEFSPAEIAAALGVSERSIHRDWRAARAWLAKRVRELQGLADGESPPESGRRSPESG